MSYCSSRQHTVRRRSLEVKVGAVGVGGNNPIRLQSMTTSDTQDIDATVKQSIALAEVGCEIVRITAPNVAAAKCLREIRARFTAAGFGHVPLVADIHFLPSAAMEAVEHVEKVRVNPGNYADKKKFAVREYSDADYAEELERLDEAFSPLVLRAKALGRSLRIGTNHGSLSDRIMNRYGDTPLGMVESALEFLRISESHGFRQLILSMKASNPKVMIEAYRLLVDRMQREDMHYPLHLGVTEAGDGEDGRIKSAIGIGSLLLDGLGDTIRVSLTEDSVYEIPVARTLADKAMSLWGTPSEGGGRKAEGHDSRQEFSRSFPARISPPSVLPPRPSDSIDPYRFSRRETESITLGASAAIGPEQPPRVIVRGGPVERLVEVAAPLSSPRLADTPAEGLLVEIPDAAALRQIDSLLVAGRLASLAAVLELAPSILPESLRALVGGWPAGTVLLREFGPAEGAALAGFIELAKSTRVLLAAAVDPADFPALSPVLHAAGSAPLIFTLGYHRRLAPPAHAVGEYRALADALHTIGSRAPVWIRQTAAASIRGDNSFLSRLLEASILAGSLLADGLGDLLSIETESDPVRATRLAYNVLQGAGARISKTEFVACPSCGRTLFDLQTTTQRIREKTGHLKGVKIAIMGCIVNGPGEMADADFGYVGGAPGKINLYVGKQCVQYNVPQAEADARLIALIREHGKWIDPAPVPA